MGSVLPCTTDFLFFLRKNYKIIIKKIEYVAIKQRESGIGDQGSGNGEGAPLFIKQDDKNTIYYRATRNYTTSK